MTKNLGMRTGIARQRFTLDVIEEGIHAPERTSRAPNNDPGIPAQPKPKLFPGWNEFFPFGQILPAPRMARHWVGNRQLFAWISKFQEKSEVLPWQRPGYAFGGGRRQSANLQLRKKRIPKVANPEIWDRIIHDSATCFLNFRPSCFNCLDDIQFGGEMALFNRTIWVLLVNRDLVSK